MFNNLVNSALLTTGGAVANPAGSKVLFGGITTLIPIIIIVVFVAYDMRQRKKVAKKHQENISNLKEGDRVVTIGGLRGEIASIGEKTFELKVDKGIRLEFEKRAIARVEKEIAKGEK